MTYITPVPLSRAGQGVSSAYSFLFFLGALGPAEAPLDDPETLEATPRPAPLRPETFNLSFSSPNWLSSHSIFQISYLKLVLWSNRSLTQLLNFSCFFSSFSTSWAKQSHCWQNPLICSSISGTCLSRVASSSHDWSIQGDKVRGLARLQKGNWPQNRILHVLGQELLPEPCPPLLAGALVLITPIEPHCDLKHISAFYGGNNI